MSVRTLRRTFAAPFVVTMAGCMVQSGSAPPPRGPGPGPRPGPVSTAPPPDRADRPGDVVQGERKPTHAASWTVMKQGETCKAYVNASCPANATCNPPPPTDYACTPQVSQNAPMKIIRHNGSETCQIDTGPMNCPPNVMCNPPPPQQVTCPK
jgi:hypothetical protein